MAAGIFFFDRFLPDVSLRFLLLVLLAVFLPLFFSAVIKFRTLRLNYSFGVIVSACFFLIGGILIVQKRKNIEYEWSDKEQCYYGVVETTPEVRGKTLCSEVRVNLAIPSTADSIYGKSINRNILLYYIPDSASYIPQCGDSIVFYSAISKPLSDIEFMGFDYERYLFTKGISGTALAFSGNWKAVRVEHPQSIRHRALRCRDIIAGKFESWDMGDNELAVVSALTIGDKSELTPELKAVYSAAGTSHVLALSGLHVGILSGILYLLLWPLRKLRGGRVVQSLAVATVLWIFAFITGLSPSVVRAVTMCTLYLVASVLVENGFCGFFSLSLTAFVMLVYNPMYLFDISFQLSFAAVFSILAFYPLFSRLLCIKNRALRYIWNMLSLSMSAQVGTLPFILYYFGSFPTYFLLANLVVVILAFGMLILSLAALCLHYVPLVGYIIISMLEWCTLISNGLMRWIQQLEGSQITSVYLSPLQASLLTVVIICLYLSWVSGIHRKACNWIRLLVVCNLFVGVSCVDCLEEHPARLYFSRSEVYAGRKGCISQLYSDTGLLCVEGLHVAVLDDDHWRSCESSYHLPLDYAYICKGFKGSLVQLNKLFVIRQVILDNSLHDAFRKKLIQECQLLKISYTDLSVQGSCSIVL